MKVDVIVPIFYINEHFEENVKSWFENIPIRMLYVGIGDREADYKKIRDILFQFQPEIIGIYYQFNNKTLGYCIKELVDKVETDWFVYLHDDVKLSENWFNDMIALREDAVVLESLKEPREIFGKQGEVFRAYSGAQIMNTNIIKEIIRDWEDDFIYTLEDIIIFYQLQVRKLKYKKVPVYHEHQGHTIERMVDRKTLMEWQVKGLVKYLPLDDYTLNYFNDSFQEFRYELLQEWKRRNEKV